MALKSELRVLLEDVPVEVPPNPVQIVGRPTDGIRPLPSGSLRTVGHCIYCGRADSLSDEHIFPYGLNGPSWLKDASCLGCATETSRVEGRVLRGALRAIRAALGIRSRSKHSGAPIDVPVEIWRGKNREDARVDRSQAPLLMPFPLFAPPRYWSGEEGIGIKIVGLSTTCFGLIEGRYFGPSRLTD